MPSAVTSIRPYMVTQNPANGNGPFPSPMVAKYAFTVRAGRFDRAAYTAEVCVRRDSDNSEESRRSDASLPGGKPKRWALVSPLHPPFWSGDEDFMSLGISENAPRV